MTAWSGCAAMMRQPPAEDRRVSDPPVCSTGRGGVVLDSLVAIGLGGGAAAALEAEEGDAALALGLLGGLFVASAVSGHRSADRCEEAIASFATYQDAVRAEARDRRADQREGRLTRSPAPTPAPAPAPAAEAEDEAETEAETEAEVETETETEREATKAETRAPPTPGSQAWREFWIEVAP